MVFSFEWIAMRNYPASMFRLKTASSKQAVNTFVFSKKNPFPMCKTHFRAFQCRSRNEHRATVMDLQRTYLRKHIIYIVLRYWINAVCVSNQIRARSESVSLIPRSRKNKDWCEAIDIKFIVLKRGKFPEYILPKPDIKPFSFTLMFRMKRLS